MIVLQILKIIGIVLACIVGFVLLILVLVLFTPITYSLSGKGQEQDIKAGAAVKWLLGFVTFRISYAEMNISYYARAAGIKIIHGDIGFGGGKSQEQAEKPGVVSEKTDTVKKAAEENAVRRTDGPSEAENENTDKKSAENSEEKQEDSSISEKIKTKLVSFIDKLKNIWNKIVTVRNKIKTVKYIIGAPVTARAWKFVKTQLFGILDHIRPKSLVGTLDFGTGDPAGTAQIYGISSVAAAMIDDRFVITPEMEEKTFAVDAVIKGRFFAGYVLISALKILMNRDVKRVVKYIRRNL